MVEIIEPHGGKVFDPACGSGGMFVQSAQFIEQHRQDAAQDLDVYVYGTEKTLETVKLAKMNLGVNGLRGEVKQANAYSEDPFGAFGNFDYVLANPPFNVDDVPLDQVEQDKRFNTYGVPRNKSKPAGAKGKDKAEQKAQETVTALYEACKPEVLSRGKARTVSAFQYLRGVRDTIVEQVDVDAAVRRLGELLDESVVVDKAETFKAKQFDAEYKIVQRGRAWDLSKVNVEKLREEFKQAPFKHIAIADLRQFIEKKLAELLHHNATRSDFAQRLQAVIDAYNSGATATEDYYQQLTDYVADLQAEAERHVREGLSEDELELFDLLKKDAMSQDETQRVKLAAKRLLKRLVAEHPKVLVQDRFKDNQTQKQVRSEIERVLDEGLPATYERALFKQKCDNVFDLVVDCASRGRKWAA
jgi:type I restriction enzyme R subunit